MSDACVVQLYRGFYSPAEQHMQMDRSEVVGRCEAYRSRSSRQVANRVNPTGATDVGAIRHAQAGFPRKGLRASSRAIKARVEAVEVLLYQTSMVMAIAWPDRRAHEGAA